MAKSDIKRRAEELCLVVHTYSPGDVITRYRFHRPGVKSYFEDSGIYTALGKKEAEIFLRGFEVGFSWPYKKEV